MKKNRLVITCLMIGVVGILLGSIGLLLGGRVYGITMGGNGIVVNSNANANSQEGYQFLKETLELEDFTDLKMDISFADVEIVESDHFALEYCVRSDRPITAEMQNGAMTISQKSQTGNYPFLSLGMVSFDTTMTAEYVNLYVPAGTAFESVAISLDSGNLTVGSLQADTITLVDSFGSITAQSLQAGDLNMDLDSGDVFAAAITAENLTIKNSFGGAEIVNAELTKGVISMDSGDVILGQIVGEELQMELSFGSVDAGTLDVDSVKVELDSGNCRIGNLCTQKLDADSSFGELEIGLYEGVAAYAADASANFGNIEVNRVDMGDVYKTLDSEGQPMLMIRCDSGDIILYDAAE
ncbi:MAG TPA: DUF4097 family beta strand repeat-containing protein [Lachnospiraceae bacterium]|nr:DUF4097 family beta strand repeat-containing protein [Lachnospiraceae bacterium]